MKQQNTRLYKTLFGAGAALVCFLLVLPTLRIMPVGAQPQTSVDTREQELDARILTFFRTLQNTPSSSAAFEDLLVQSPLNSPGAALQLADLKSQVDEMKNKFGDILHWERYDSKPIGTDVMVMRYILKYDQYPVVWSFAFYRKPSPSSIINPNRWVLVEIEFEPSLL